MAKTNRTINKSWLTVGLVAAALTLSACGSKEESPTETESPVDAQTAVEEEATGTATADNDVAVAGANDDVAVASADGIAVSDNDDVAVATDDDSEMLDGTESSEHVSTYQAVLIYTVIIHDDYLSYGYKIVGTVVK